MKVILPSAGYGTRLYPLTLNKPKALLDVAGKPIIEYAIEKVSNLKGVDKIIIVSNDKFYNNFKEWSDKYRSNILIKVLNDGTKSNEDRLGSVGDINFALKKEKIKDDFLVINSDNLFSFDFEEVFNKFNKIKKPIIGIYDVKKLEIAREMGSVQLNNKNKVVFFKEKYQNVKSPLISIGIYFFTKKCIKLLDNFLKLSKSSDRSGDFIEWLYKKEDVYGFIFKSEEKWFDIGSIESYEKAKKIFVEHIDNWGN